MLLAALSCFQGRLAGTAAADLLDLGFDGIQLTPGCAPDPGLNDALNGVVARTHHGYTPVALRCPVWDEDGGLLVSCDSVHPPKVRHTERFFADLDAGRFGSVAMETMYPGSVLGTGNELARYLSTGAPLAVDVSHLDIQRHLEVIDDSVIAAVLDYGSVSEVHLSQAEMGVDRHRPVDGGSYLLGWVRERLADGMVVVLESYLHGLGRGEQERQIGFIREALR